MLLRRVKRGETTPSWDRRPLLHEDLVQIWNGWYDLHASRASGFGVCGLTVSDITDWLKLQGFTIGSESALDAYELLKSMDLAWLKYASTKQKETKPDNANAPTHNRRQSR